MRPAVHLRYVLRLGLAVSKLRAPLALGTLCALGFLACARTPSPGLTSTRPRLSAELHGPQTVTRVGAAQGVEFRDGRYWIYGDAEVGVIRAVDAPEESRPGLRPSSVIIRLTREAEDLLPHPTGLTFHERHGTWLGNTVGGLGTLFLLDWARAVRDRTLDHAVRHRVLDDAAVNGTRPEFVRLGRRWLVATSDYGDRGNQVRLYDPTRLARATRTTEPEVLVHAFACGPFVQSLYWWDERGWLVLVQNQVAGLKWRVTMLDLAASVREGSAVVTQRLDLEPGDELEGFHGGVPAEDGSLSGVFVSSSSVSNARLGTLRPLR